MSKAANEMINNLKKFNLTLTRGRSATLTLCFFLVLVGIIMLPGQTDKFDRIFFDFSQSNLSGYLSCSPELAVVAVDTETLDGVKQRWPWTRTKFAEFFRTINSFKPKAIILDIVFQHSENSDGGAGDQILVQMLRDAGNIAMIGFVEEEITEVGRKKRQFRSLKEFRDVAYCDGYVHSFVDSDSKIRTFSIRDNKFGQDSCLLKVAKLTRQSVEAQNRLSNLPEKSQIIFARQNGGIPLYRGLDLIEGKISGDFLKDKIVVVGATAFALHDFHQTCMGMTSGPEILAAALDTILTERASSPITGFSIRILLVILGILTSAIFAIRKKFTNELLTVFIYLSALIASYHILAIFQIFPPMSCLFLTWAFVSLTYSLIKRFIEMIEQQISKAEAELAGKIQGELFPEHFIESPPYGIRGICLPCDATGGDFFDYFELEDKSLIFVLGDVAGHGFPAAILTVMAKTTIQLLRQKSMISPEDIVSTLNQVIFELVKKKKFMTLAVGHINIETHQLNMVLAGHLPPVVVSAKGEIQELAKPGFPMGIVKKLPIQALSYEIKPGDSIILFTDGIVEAMNWKDEQYTFPVWYKFLQKTMPTFTKNCDLGKLLVGVNKHKQGRCFDDDVTYVIVQRHQ